MKWTLYGVLFLGTPVLAAWLVFSWFEADKELRILCQQFSIGQSLESVNATLATGDYLRVSHPKPSTLYVDSVYNLGRSSCRIDIVNGVLSSTVYVKA